MRRLSERSNHPRAGPACHHGRRMSAPGSVDGRSAVLSPAVAFTVVAACVLGMMSGLVLAQVLAGAGWSPGLRGTLLLSQGLLAAPALLALRVRGVPAGVVPLRATAWLAAVVAG